MNSILKLLKEVLKMKKLKLMGIEYHTLNLPSQTYWCFQSANKSDKSNRFKNPQILSSTACSAIK